MRFNFEFEIIRFVPGPARVYNCLWYEFAATHCIWRDDNNVLAAEEGTRRGFTTNQPAEHKTIIFHEYKNIARMHIPYTWYVYTSWSTIFHKCRRPRWIARLSSWLLKSISRVQFSPSSQTRSDFFLHEYWFAGSARAWVGNIRWKSTSSGNGEPYAR